MCATHVLTRRSPAQSLALRRVETLDATGVFSLPPCLSRRWTEWYVAVERAGCLGGNSPSPTWATMLPGASLLSRAHEARVSRLVTGSC